MSSESRLNGSAQPQTDLPRETFSSKSPEELQLDIAQTRARLEQSVDDLSFKLSPAGLSQEAKAALQGTQARTFGVLEDLGERLQTHNGSWNEQATAFVRRHAASVTLVGLGLAWLLRSSHRR